MPAATWELHITRLGIHRSQGQERTYGRYDVTIGGAPAPGLNGFVCESPGPGDNSTPGNGKRVEAGRYRLWTQFGGVKYQSAGYSPSTTVTRQLKMPGFLLDEDDTRFRTDILVHPGHPANEGDPPWSYLSSVGCLNLTADIGPNDDIHFWDSRARVIALLDSLKTFAPAAFVPTVRTMIPNAYAVIVGEPMALLLAPAPPLVAGNPVVDIQGSGST
jgi:hypothetical protein